jgi:hypothetical protein
MKFRRSSDGSRSLFPRSSLTSPRRTWLALLALGSGSISISIATAACSGGDDTVHPYTGNLDGSGGRAGTGAAGGGAGANQGGTSGFSGSAGEGGGEGAGAGGGNGGNAGEAGSAGEAGAAGAGNEAGASGSEGEGGDTGSEPVEGVGGSEGIPSLPEGCPDVPAGAPTAALSFDGVDDYVSMGNAKGLGLGQFTVEAWIRRDGPGLAMSTGVGGLRLVPIAGKGRGENDNTIYNCNYTFGIVNNRLAVDYEDTDNGGNHPLVGSHPIGLGEWHHVATSFDGTSLRLYLDGVLDAKLPVTAGNKPRADSVQHFGIGAGLDSKGVAAGAFQGLIDEVRVWKTALTDAQVAKNAYHSLTSVAGGANLVARWGFDDGTATDSIGTAHGTLFGAVSVAPGAPVDRGTPPTFLGSSPPTGAEVAPPAATLQATFQDPDDDSLTADLYVRTLTAADDFTVVVLPDTRAYVDEATKGKWASVFDDQTKWIVENRAAQNIVAVLHNGDVTENGQGFEAEWTRAAAALGRLEDTKSTGLTAGLPFAVAVGDHDNRAAAGKPSTAGNTALFNKFFGVAHFSTRTYFGGHYGDTNDESFVTFNAGGLDFVVVSYQYAATDTPSRQAVLKWGRSVFDAYPRAFGIVNAHSLIGSSGAFSAQGQAIYDSVSSAANVHLMTSAHVSAEKRRTDTLPVVSPGDGKLHDHTIVTMLADYVSLGKTEATPDAPTYLGGSGYLRVWRFSPQSNTLTVSTYSPTLKQFQTDAESAFVLPVDLSGSGGAFTKLATKATANPDGSVSFRADLATLVPGNTYEWYARIRDCDHVRSSPLQRFTTTK